LNGAVSNAVDLIRYLLLEDMELPPEYLDGASFDAAKAATNCTAGLWFGTDVVQGTDAIEALLTAVGGYLVPRRDGTLGILLLRPPAQADVVASWGAEKIITCVPHALPTTVGPPPYRFRVGYQRNYTVQTETDLLPTVSSDRVSYLANEYRYGGWSSTAVLNAYRRPNDPQPIPTALQSQTDAEAVAGVQGALWGTLRSLFDVTVPMAIGLPRELGDTIALSFPQTLVATAQPALIVGDQINSEDSTITFTLLV
jgi:hypothetical protein